MGELTTTTIVGIGGFIIGLVFGAVVQRTNFCTMGAISDLVLMGDGRRFRAWILTIAVAIIGTQALHFSGAIDVNKSVYLTPNLGWLGAIIGGAMFGFGMTLAGGCGSKTVVRLGGRQSEITGGCDCAWPRRLYDDARVTGAGTDADGGRNQYRPQDARAQHSEYRRDGGCACSACRAIPCAPSRRWLVAVAFLVFCFKDAAFRRSPPTSPPA